MEYTINLDKNGVHKLRDISIKEKDFYLSGVHIADSYTRVVHGKRGAYVEFLPQNIDLNQIEVEPGQEYRLTDKWKKLTYYAWYRTKESHKKVYFQYKKVDYADYLPGMYYISVKDLEYDGELYTEKSDVPLD